LLAEFNQVINKLIETHSEEEFNTNYTPRITQITERYLGKGKKVNNCNRDQVEQLSLIVSEIKDLA
jgi:hypothetical protein